VVDRPRLDQLLALLAQYVRFLRELAVVPLEDFESDPRNFGSAERFLQLAIETTLSIGHHIIAERGFNQPTTYAAVYAVLGEQGVLDRAFAADLQPMARMRNRLVHHYEDITPARVHDIIGSHLDDFDQYSEQVLRYVDALPPLPD
jgi:uncharacterized protein YutE (UPF0331/DUF86 family)